MRRFLMMLTLVSAGCGAQLRNVPASLDPSSPDGPEGVVPPPPLNLAEQKPAPTDSGPGPGTEGQMPGMQHDMPGMQHDGSMNRDAPPPSKSGGDDKSMPGMQHNMPGMQHDKPTKPGKSSDKSMPDMPDMQHDKPTKPDKSNDESMPGMQHGNGGGAATPPSAKEGAPKPKAKTIYRCPMHPEVVSDKPGRCPKCGMKLELQKETGGAP